MEWEYFGIYINISFSVWLSLLRRQIHKQYTAPIGQWFEPRSDH